MDAQSKQINNCLQGPVCTLISLYMSGQPIIQRPRVVISSFIKRVTQAAFMVSPVLLHSPSCPSSLEGFLGARQGRPSAPSPSAAARPSWCPQGTVRGAILGLPAGSAAGRWKAGVQAAQASGGLENFAVRLRTRPNVPEAAGTAAATHRSCQQQQHCSSVDCSKLERGAQPAKLL